MDVVEDIGQAFNSGLSDSDVIRRIITNGTLRCFIHNKKRRANGIVSVHDQLVIVQNPSCFPKDLEPFWLYQDPNQSSDC
jgi:hypothetical protein